ncbi:MarR family winged helix-turn-helix transcriptional regulator [Secundilactobacillus folii]|uniref:MarR family transcriptional regulator n=1 Tax=Secundilactobacillus folii TaxID=2678357 RepID=A0A7X2XXV4_9LACO|nr:MarR family transcriptional regulator [Secundilactobacillus folii]MTV82341.1 MarR family transcriptional regulator [Secundilactobacillus folii]
MSPLGIGISTGIFSRKARAYLKAVIKKMGIKEVDAIILINVKENPGIIQERIGQNLTLDNAMVARRLKQLEADELIKRMIDQANQRTKKVYIEPTGEEYVNRIIREMSYWDSMVVKGLSDQEKQTLASSLAFLKNRAEEININDVLTAREANED